MTNPEPTTVAVRTPETAPAAGPEAEAPPAAERPVQTRSRQIANPMDLLAEAIARDVDLPKLEKLMELEERWRENAARDAYVKAMAKFRSEAIEITKTKRVGYDHKEGGGRTEYSYAPLSEVLDAVVPFLSKHKLAHQWTTRQDEHGVTVTCVIRHVDGHSEETSLFAAPDPSGRKNAIQAVGSTVTYLQRYTLLALAGLAAGDQDDDARGADPEPPISTEQLETLDRLIEDAGADRYAFLSWVGVPSMEEVPASKFSECVAALKAKQKAGG